MKIVIIDHSKPTRENHKSLLLSNFPNMKIIGEANTVMQSIEILKSTSPDIVLMDAKLSDGNAFQILQACTPCNFNAIFITNNKDYAVKAIKFGIIDYLLKPVNEYEFCDAIKKAIRENLKNNRSFNQIETKTTSNEAQKRILLKTANSMHLIDIQDIIYCKSNNSYTSFFIKDHKSIIVSKSIKEYSQILSGHGFIRPHQSYLINTNSISRIDKADGGIIILNKEIEIPISKRLKQSILDELSKLTKLKL